MTQVAKKQFGKFYYHKDCSNMQIIFKVCFYVSRRVALICGSCNLSCYGMTKLEPSMLQKSLFMVTIHLAFAFNFVVTALC